MTTKHINQLFKYGLSLLFGAIAFTGAVVSVHAADQTSAEASAPQGKKPNILILWGDDIGWENPSCYNRGMMGYQTPNNSLL